MQMFSVKMILGGVAAAALATAAHATTLATLDFDNPFTVDTGVFGSFGPFSFETANVGAWNAAGWAGRYAANRTGGNPASFTTLSLFGLAPHTTISASFVLGFLESWDGYDGGCCSPDNLEIWVDGVQISNMTATNALGSADDFDGNPIIAYRDQVNGTYFFSDTLIGYSKTFAHSASTLSLGIRASGAGWQGGGDEAWGIDNIKLTYDGHGGTGGVPEPATWALMIAGFGLAGATLRRRRTLTAG